MDVRSRSKRHNSVHPRDNRIAETARLLSNLMFWRQKPSLETPDSFLERFSTREEKDSPRDSLRERIIVDPSSALYYRWLFIISSAVLYNTLLVIARSVFWLLQNKSPDSWLAIDLFSDTLYLVDMLVEARTAFLSGGLLVRDSRSLANNYMKSMRFRFDVFSLIPSDFILLTTGLHCNPHVIYPCPVIARLNRILRAHRVFEFFERTETRTSWPHAFRIFKLLVLILVLIHCNACAYFALSRAIGFDSDKWVYNRGNRSESLRHQYVYCFYWSTLTLTTIGEVPPPETDLEHAFVVLNFLIGVLIFATIVGNVGSMISNMSAARAAFQSRLDAVKQYMAFRRVSPSLEARVVAWFDYLRTNGQSLDERNVTSVLSDRLRAEIAIHVHLNTLRRVSLFQDCDPGLLTQLVLRLRLQVFCPRDYICRKGDIGTEMYIVKSGLLSVVADDLETELATLSDGSVFGELSILNISGNKTGNRRTATVRSVGYSDLFVLSKSDLWTVLEDFPEAKALLIARGTQILRKDNLIDEEALTRAQQQELELASRVSQLAEHLDSLQTRFARLLAEYAASQKRLKQRLTALESR